MFKRLKLNQIRRISRWSGTTFFLQTSCKIAPSL